MADKPHPPGAPPEGARRRKRAAPTIDLTATEVGAAEAPRSKPDPAPEQRAQHAAGFPAQLWQWAKSNMSGPTLAAGFAGGVLVGLLMFAMWIGGLVPVRYANTVAMDPRVGALEAQVQELRSRPASNPADAKALDALSQRIAKLEGSVAKLPAGEPGLAERVGAIDNALQSLGIALTALNKRNEDVAARAVDSDALEKRIAALEGATKATREDIARNTGADTAARLALSAVTLREIVLRGAPFAAELAAAKSLAGDAQTLAPLEPFAASGLPSDAALARELSAVLPAMIDRAGVKAPSGNFFDRLQANAGKLVRITPIDAPPGNDPSAVLARIEVAIARPDIAALLAELARLPDNVRAPAEAWIKKANERQAAMQAARQFAADASRALGTR